jgi:hypothetical protein
MADLRLEECINETCPWSGKPVQADSLTLYQGQVVGFWRQVRAGGRAFREGARGGAPAQAELTGADPNAEQARAAAPRHPTFARHHGER